MTTYIDIGPYVITNPRYERFKGAKGRLYISVEPLTDDEFAHYKYSAPTIAEIQAGLDQYNGQMLHSFSNEDFYFDLSPWNHLPKETHLALIMGFKFDPGQNYKMPPEILENGTEVE